MSQKTYCIAHTQTHTHPHTHTDTHTLVSHMYTQTHTHTHKHFSKAHVHTHLHTHTVLIDNKLINLHQESASFLHFSKGGIQSWDLFLYFVCPKKLIVMCIPRHTHTHTHTDIYIQCLIISTSIFHMISLFVSHSMMGLCGVSLKVIFCDVNQK